MVLPADQATAEDSTLAFTGAASITVTDADAATDAIRLDLTVTSGILSYASTTGLTFVSGSSNNRASIKVTGTLTALDAALDGLTLTPAPNATDTVTITAVANDLGHNGDDGAKSDTDTMDITVSAVVQGGPARLLTAPSPLARW